MVHGVIHHLGDIFPPLTNLLVGATMEDVGRHLWPSSRRREPVLLSLSPTNKLGGRIL